eukprot:325763_1
MSKPKQIHTRASSNPTTPKPKRPKPPRTRAPSRSITRTPPRKRPISARASPASPESAANNIKCAELEKDALKLCSDGDKFEEKKLFRRAIKCYTFGINKLAKTLNYIKKTKVKKQRVQQITKYKAKKSKCQSTLKMEQKERREAKK